MLSTYHFIFPDTIKAEEQGTIFPFTSDEIIYTLSPPALMAIIKSEIAGFFSIFSLGPISCL